MMNTADREDDLEPLASEELTRVTGGKILICDKKTKKCAPGAPWPPKPPPKPPLIA